MERLDLEVREELVRTGELFDGYHPRMEAVHRQNGRRLAEILDAHGWPGRSLVGEDGANAAWLVAQHAIGSPDLMRRSRDLVTRAIASGEAEPWTFAYLDDRIRTFEGLLQRYGTQFHRDETGRLAPLPIEDPEEVDARRGEVGLEPLAERLAKMRSVAAAEREGPPPDREAWLRGYEAWLREVGWRE